MARNPRFNSMKNRLRARFRKPRSIKIGANFIKYEGGTTFANVISPIDDGQILYIQPIVFTEPAIELNADWRNFPNIAAESVINAAYNTIRAYVKGPLAAMVAKEFAARPYNEYGIQVGSGASEFGEIHNAEHTKQGFRDLEKVLKLPGEYQEGGQMVIGIGPEERVLGLRSRDYSFNGSKDNTYGVWFMNVEFGTGQFTQTFRRISGEFKPPGSEGEWFMQKYDVGQKPEDEREDGGPVDPLQARIDALDSVSRDWIMGMTDPAKRREALGTLLGQQLDMEAEERGESSFAQQETLEQGFFGAKVFGQLPFHVFFDSSGNFKEKYWQKIIKEGLPPFWKENFEKYLDRELGR